MTAVLCIVTYTTGFVEKCYVISIRERVDSDRAGAVEGWIVRQINVHYV